VSQDERRAQRRSQLIAAAIQVYGEIGYRQATVKAVCEAAGLTER
jgi:AcrR family transcriptional regulator